MEDGIWLQSQMNFNYVTTLHSDDMTSHRGRVLRRRPLNGIELAKYSYNAFKPEAEVLGER